MSKEKSALPCCPNRARAAVKIAVIIAALLGLLGLLAVTIDESAIDRIKFDLSLWSLIAVVLMINLASCAVFTALFFAYQWVRRDLKTPRVEDERDPSDL